MRAILISLIMSWNCLLPPKDFKLQIYWFCEKSYEWASCWRPKRSAYSASGQRPRDRRQVRTFQPSEYDHWVYITPYLVTEQRRKKEVISIDDSEEEASLQPKAPKPKERKQPNDTRKPKKFTNRCMLCKEPGKKTSMKVCLDCRAFVHQACLEQEGESLVRYRCRKCRHKREEDPLGSKKGEKGEKGN